MRVLVLWAMVGMLGCGSKQAAAPAPAPAATAVAPAEVKPLSVGDLRFAWPAPGRVVVEERATKKGKSARMRYSLTIEPAAEGLHISYGDFEFLEVAGIDVRDPANAEALAQAAALTSLIPSLEISREGELTSFIGFEKMMDEVLALLLRDLPPARQELMKAIVNTPAFRETVEESATAAWNAWVYVWTRDDLPAAGEAAEYELEDGGGTFEYENHGLQPDGTLRLVFRTSEDTALSDELAMLRELGADPSALSGTVTTHVTFQVETTRTLQPSRSSYEVKVEVNDSAGAKHSFIESHEYTFSW